MAGTFFEMNYAMEQRIGKGSFGEVYIARDTNTNEQIAVKLEDANMRKPQLYNESQIMRKLKGQIGFPTVRWYGSNETHNILVMDLLGPSVDEVFVS